MTAWLAARATERSLHQRLLVASAMVVVAPPFAHAMAFGNVGAAAVGFALAGIALAARRPVGAGALLTASLTLKPVAVIAVPLLACGHAEVAPGAAARRFVSATIAVAASAILVAAPGLALLTAFLARHAEVWLSPFQLGLGRVASEVGILLPTWLPPVFVIGAGSIWLRRRIRSAPLFEAVLPALALLASPIVWLHTLALALPVQLRALLGPNAARAGLRRPLELALRGALALAIWGAGAVGAIAPAPPVVRLAVGVLPLLSVLVLTLRCAADDATANARPASGI